MNPVFETIQFPTRVASLHASLTDVNRDDFPHDARSDPKSRVSKSRVDINAHTCVCVFHRTGSSSEMRSLRRVRRIVPTRRIIIIASSSRQRDRCAHSSFHLRESTTSPRDVRARAIARRMGDLIFLFLLDPTTNAPRRTRRVDARETRARRDDASMDDESSRSSDDRPRDR